MKKNNWIRVLFLLMVLIGGPVWGQSLSVTGKVTSGDDGLPLPGVNVFDKANPLKGVISDPDGVFTIQVPEDGTLVFSFVGMKTTEVSVKGKKTIDVVLQPDYVGLEEVVAIGYGTQKKANLTGSVATVKAEQLASRPAQSISSAISGTMAGVAVSQTSGAPGGQKGNISIRGASSINGGDPLVIIDGVQSTLSAMNNMDMEDIDNVSILKDATSAAIYGVQAANGVILITTKKGKKGMGPQVSYSNNFAWTTPTYTPDYLGSYDYAVLYNEAYLNENPGNKAPFSEDDLKKFKDGSDPYGHPNTDWFDTVLKDWAFEQHHHLGLSGGTEKTSYSASVGWLDQGGLIENYNYERFTWRANVNSQVSDRLNMGFSFSGHKDGTNENWNKVGSIYSWLCRTPPTVPINNPDGTPSYHGYANPEALIGNDGFRDHDYTQFLGIGNFTYNILKGLDLKGTYSYQNNHAHKMGFKKYVEYQNEDGSMPANTGKREMYEESYYTTRTNGQLLLTFDRTFGDHSINAIGGYEQYEYDYDYIKTSRKGFKNDELHELNAGDPDTQKNEGSGKGYSRQALFGRVQYNYQGKYLLEGNIRSDKTSRFAEDERWGLFPSFSAGWRLSEEAFLSDVSWLDNLKLRGGFGSTGNQETGPYEYQSTYAYKGEENGENKFYVFGNKVVSPVEETRYANQFLSWATVKSTEAAVEGSILNGLLGWELGVYQKRTEDMILELPVPSILGLEPPSQNLAELENRGFEMVLTHRQTLGDFQYDVALNYGYNKNEITDLKGADGEDNEHGPYYNGKGFPYGSFYGYECIGFYESEEDIANSPSQSGNLMPGDLKYKDQDGDGDVDGDDRVVMGQNTPKYTFGLNTNLKYKNWDMSLFFQGAGGHDVYFQGEAAYSFFNGGKVLQRHMDRWTPTNKDASYPRLTMSNQTNFKPSSFWLEDGDYVRLKNLTIGYNVPKQVLDMVGISSLRFYFAGENLLTWAKSAEDFDPEAPSVNRGWFYGNVKKISFGLKANF